MIQFSQDIGIDKISFYTPNFYIKLEELALRRNIDPEKFLNGLGQHRMSTAPPDEDIVTMSAAAIDALELDSYDNIDWLIIATESGIDHSKSASIYVHKLLNMPNNVKPIEMKQACASGAAALELALSYVNTHPKKKVLIVNSDISRYGLASNGESSQGAAAVALLVSSNPSIMKIEPFFGTYSEERMDFWRPNYCNEAIVKGKYSCMLYLSFLENSYFSYVKQGGREVRDLDACCFHTPFPKLAEKAYSQLIKIGKIEKINEYSLDYALKYTKDIGNCYTASLFLSLISLLDSKVLQGNSYIGMYSYGSGSTAMYFCGQLIKSYKKVVNSMINIQKIKSRKLLSIPEYEEMYNFQLPSDGSSKKTPILSDNRYRLCGIEDHKRLYSTNL